ncbi:MAG: 8-amino-7-oxononanoate synthase [Planctomycetes bacterium RBG_16_59_8]|nr:MAG: 8-amino-7-oxononanoate synthase [Planctomycetes bacterium RBG_16_59_8]
MDLFKKCYGFTRHKEIMANGLYPYFKAIQSGSDTEVVVNGKKMIMIGSNNYLGLTQHPKVKEAAIKAVEKYGSSCTGSRFLNGTLDIHEELEEKLARFMKKESALVFSTGFQTNLGAISTLVSKDTYVLCDRMNHASIIDGCRLSFGNLIKYKHNNMKDLERILMTLEDNGGCLIVVDGVFSMEGDVVCLPEIVELKRKYGARLMVDDAHGIGVMGDHGRGTAEHFDCEKEVDVVMGTFSKSFASLGGFVVGEREVTDYIKHHARSLIFSASIPPSNAAAVIAVLEVMEKEPERRKKLWANARKMMKGFRSLGFDIGKTETPVIPIIIGDDEKTFMFWKLLFEAGVFVNPIISPAVPPDQSLLRTSYMATHTDAQLDRVLETFKKIGKKLAII